MFYVCYKERKSKKQKSIHIYIYIYMKINIYVSNLKKWFNNGIKNMKMHNL